MNRKLWGLFTGSQLTVMFVAVMVATMPGSLWAVASFQRVVIMDHKSGSKAQVDKQRRLSVYDERLGVDEWPKNFVRFVRSASTTCQPLATAPAGKALVVKSLHLDTIEQSAPGVAYVELVIGSTCSGLVAFVDTNGVGVTPLHFDPGLVVPAGQALWLFKSSSNIIASVSGTGYLVPKSWAPTSPNNLSQGGADALRR